MMRVFSSTIPLGYPGYSLMRCPFRSVSIRPWLEIRFEDRLQDEL